jgi:hypothetical protein
MENKICGYWISRTKVHCKNNEITILGHSHFIIYTVPKAEHISEKYLGEYIGASPLAGKFPKAV